MFMDQVSSLQMKIFHGQILKLEMFFGHITKKKKKEKKKLFLLSKSI